MLSDNNKLVSEASLWEWVKAISTLSAVGVISYKVYLTPINLTIDFPTLLSLLLALFSVGLAALFYFKATDTSNTFYDNSYNFTKDIAQLLVKIESGFGEKLKNLDEGYTAMRTQLQITPYANGEVEETKQKIEGEKKEIEKVIEERNLIIRQLIERSQLQQEDKEIIIEKLSNKEKELDESHRELNRMNKRLLMERMKKREQRDEIDSNINIYTINKIISNIGVDMIDKLSSVGLKRRVNAILNDAPHQYLEDLKRHGYFENGITSTGLQFIRKLAIEYA